MTPGIEWQQELLYQRFATWEPKYTVPTVRELEMQLMREHFTRQATRVWARHVEAMMERKVGFGTFSVDHWTVPKRAESGDLPG